MGATDRRTYRQYCGTARALDVLGERWTLLIVRDLLPGPRRYGELAAGLPGISSDILTARLRTLEQHDLVSRLEEPGVGRPVSYRLTDAGERLRPVIEQLADIGVRWLGPPAETDARFGLSWALGTAASHLDPDEVPSIPLVLVGPDQHFVIERAGDRVEVRYLERPVAGSVVVGGSADELLVVLSGHAPLDAGQVTVDGDARAASAWVDALVGAIPEPIRGPHGPGAEA